MTGTDDVAIKVRALVKRYGSFEALHGIDLEVSRGEVFGFIGPNGAGKTTLIRTMLDLIRPSKGEIRIFGLDSRRDARQIHARTGYVPGELGLWEKLTARQALSHLAGLRRGVGVDRIEGLAERLRLTLDRPIRELSKGNKEKVGLVQAGSTSARSIDSSVSSCDEWWSGTCATRPAGTTSKSSLPAPLARSL